MPPEAPPAINPQQFLRAGFSPRTEVRLSELGTFRIGGPVHLLLECMNPQDLGTLRRICRTEGIPALLIGEGSNLLFSDDGWPGLLARYAGEGGLPEPVADGIWRFPASTNLQQAVDWAATRGLSGLEAFNGIPGTLGGAVAGNAGAWGVQMEHVLEQVSGYDAEGTLRRLAVTECGFSYRDSRLKHNGFWISEADLHLQPGNSGDLKKERERILALRATKHPDLQKEPCIGSFFKNLEPSSAAERRQAAGYFLEQAGAKQFREGGAAVFEKHANILIKNSPDCRAADVAALARRLQGAVKKMHGIDLVREVRYLGEIPGESPGKGFY